MQDYPSFGTCLKSMLDSRDLSVQEAARMFGMKSSTSLARIIHDEVNFKTLERFWNQLQENETFFLSTEETQMLQRALSIQQMGLEQYLSHEAMWKLLLSGERPACPEDIELKIYGEASRLPFSVFSQLIDFFTQCREVEIILSGCCYPRFMDLLLPLFRQNEKAPSLSLIHCLHGFQCRSHVLIKNINAILPLLSLNNYTAYIADRKNMKQETAAPYRGNEMLCTVKDSENNIRRFHGVLIEKNKMMLIEYAEETPYKFQADQFWHHHAQLSPIKTRTSSGLHLQDYWDYTQYLMQQEDNRAIYSIKPDLPLPCIHPDLILPGLIQGLKNMNLPISDERDIFIQKMYQTHLQRWKNVFEKKKITHIIFEIGAMMNFARTGVLSDHFFAMSPFSPLERRLILTHLRTQMQENPYFNIHFSSDPALPFHLEITCFDQKSMLICGSSASYDLYQGHSESNISQGDFCQVFQEFYINELLPSHVHPPRASLTIMDQLISMIPSEAP